MSSIVQKCLLHRRLSDIFRRGKRHFRRNFRNRSEDQEASPGSSQATPPMTRSSSSSTEGKSPSSAGITSTDGGSAALPPAPKQAEALSSSETRASGDSSKDRIQHWIHEQISGFLQKWEGSADQNPALSVVKKLVEATQELDPTSVSCLLAARVSGSVMATGWLAERGRERERERGEGGRERDGGVEVVFLHTTSEIAMLHSFCCVGCL